MTAPPPPRVNRLIIEALLDAHAQKLVTRRLVLVRGLYPEHAPAAFAAKVGNETRRVHVSQQNSVLGIVDAWRQHRTDASREDDVLVITTDVADRQLGWDVKGHAVRQHTLAVENAEIVKQRFGVKDLDPRLYRETWLLEALLDAEPAGGWPRPGTLLTRDTAMRSLLVARLGLGFPETPGTGTTIDADTLLGWSLTPAGPGRFTDLPARERKELSDWLSETTGPAVGVLMSLVESGHGHDAMARGLLGAALADPETGPDTVLAVGGLFGQARRDAILAFAHTVAGTLTRWIGEARHSERAHRRVLDVIDRADQLADGAGLTQTLRAGHFLRSSFVAQTHHFVDALGQSPGTAEAALAELRTHALAALAPERLALADMAVRIARWLKTPPADVPSVAQGVRTHLAVWGWVDRALNALWAGDPDGDPVVDRAYRQLYAAARARRDALDEQFAARLVPWARTADAHHTGGCLLVENVLTEVALPLLLPGTAPLLVLLDGMSSAAAVQIGEEAERDGWIEAVPRSAAAPADGVQRLAAVSMLPSVTRVSRTSLFTAAAAKGGQHEETAGFTAYWKRHHRTAHLFHKAAIAGVSGQRLTDELAAALASDAVVGVVLNTIDDALDHGQQGERTQWRIGDITFLRELLAGARSYGRPVLLVADHGHVLDRGTPAPARPAGAESARWRTGAADAGEVELTGPRVLEGAGTIVAPWREDIRYTPRKSGYHGGASLAEMTVPLLVLLPEPDLLPSGWQILPREQTIPPWWSERPAGSFDTPAAPPAAEAERPAGAAPRRRGRKDEQPAREGLFAESDLPTGRHAAATAADEPGTLGARVVASEVFAAQRIFVRKGPAAQEVAAVIDALADAGETMSPAALATAIGAGSRVKRNMDGFVATLQRLLNVEGYPVLTLADSGRTVRIDVRLLRTQFQLEGDRS
jgi:hypothetical protein